MRVVNPATGDLLGDVPDTTPAALDAALALARAAQVEWRARTVRDRAARNILPELATRKGG